MTDPLVPTEPPDADDVVLHARINDSEITLSLDLDVALRHMRDAAIAQGGSALFDENGFMRDEVMSDEYKATAEYQAERAEREAARLQATDLPADPPHDR